MNVPRLVGPAACLGCVAADLATGISTTLSPVPFIASLVLIGLPHGALDLSLGRRWDRDRFLVAACVYLAGMAAMAFLWVAAPWAFVAIFLGLTAWHFSERDPDPHGGPAREVSGDPARDVFDRPEVGLAVLAVPAVTQADAYAAVLGGLAAAFVPASAIDPAATATAGAILLWFATAAAVAGFASGRLKRVDAVELAALVAAGAVLDPLFFVGLFLVAWHGVRHLAELAEGPLTPREFARLHLASWPLTVPSWLLIGVAAWWMGTGFGTTAFALLVVGFYGIVTPSHHVLVEAALGSKTITPGVRPATVPTASGR